MYRITTPPRRFFKPLLISGVLVLALAGSVAALELSGTTHLFSDNTAETRPTASQSTKGEVDVDTQPSSSAETNPQDTTKTEAGDNKSASSGGSTANLIVPNGNFVSAHKDVPLSATLSSVCNTTAGASCKITFTSGSTVKSLPSQTADRGGTAYWNSWTPASIGLTPGTWDVEASATLGDKTQSAKDALKLEVAQ